MVSELDSGASSPGSSPGQGHCVVFLGKALYSHSVSLHPANSLLSVTESVYIHVLCNYTNSL